MSWSIAANCIGLLQILYVHLYLDTLNCLINLYSTKLELDTTPRYLKTRGHRQAVTCAVVSKDGKYLFTSGKEGTIITTNLSTGKQINAFRRIKLDKDMVEGKGKGKQKATLDLPGHTDEILALAISEDGKYLASGGKDRKLVVWDIEKVQWLRNFGGHKDTISVLVHALGLMLVC